VGQRIGPEEILVHDVRRMEKVVRDEKIDVAVLAVPARAAQRVLNQITTAGVKAVLNFAPAPLAARRGVKVKTVDLTTSLESLSYFLARPQVGAVTSGRRNARFEEVAEQKERELAMHLLIYRERSDVKAVCHAHPPHGTAFAVAGLAIDQPILSEVILTLGCVPLAGYGTPSTDELTDAMRPLLKHHNALLMANHGAVAYGSDIWQAF